MTKVFKNEFYKFRKKILNKENFSLLRLGDGEVSLMQGKRISASQALEVDKWSCENKKYKLGEDLIKSLSLTDNKIFYGLPSPQQSYMLYKYLKNFILLEDSNLTFADIWVNSNYPFFKKMIVEDIKESIVLIANEEIGNNIEKNKIAGINLIDFMPIPNDCANFYENNHESFLASFDKFHSLKNTLFIISAGPLSEPIIHRMFNNNADNRYIDVGSATDEIFKKRITRFYVKPGDFFSNISPMWV